jgi:hypothetical protein
MSLLTTSGFKRGDHILVTPMEKLAGGNADFGVLRGTALSDLAYGGTSVFEMELLVGVSRHLLRLNCNDVDVRLLFSASVARGKGSI